MAETRLLTVAPGSRLLLIRRGTFSASHRLWNPARDEEWNRRTFGPCGRPHGHGHNYVVEVAIQGVPEEASGMIMNLTELQAAIRERILDRVDHRHLNHDVPFLAEVIPTTENVALAFWRELESAFPPGALYRLRLWETENNSVELVRSDLREA
ncbi:MAG: 6-carboxytetrahydropterin synthase [Pyrinomonadaceae bacterium]